MANRRKGAHSGCRSGGPRIPGAPGDVDETRRRPCWQDSSLLHLLSYLPARRNSHLHGFHESHGEAAPKKEHPGREHTRHSCRKRHSEHQAAQRLSASRRSQATSALAMGFVSKLRRSSRGEQEQAPVDKGVGETVARV